MYCSQHHQKSAAGACVVCRKLYCDDCLVEIDNKFYCKEHAADLIGIGGSKPSFEQDPCHREYHHHVHMHGHGDCYPAYRHKSRLVAFLLCFFFGVAGFHRFYVGKIGTGIIYLFTGGFFGIGYIIDLIVILCGSFRDANGMFLE